MNRDIFKEDYLSMPKAHQKDVVYEYTLRWQDGLYYNQTFASRLDCMEIKDRYNELNGPRIVKRPRRDEDWKDDE